MPAEALVRWQMPEALVELSSDGDFSLVVELIDVFVGDTDEKIRDLEQLAEWDAPRAAALGHSIKGAARQMNLVDFGEAAFRLEKAATDGAGNCPELIAELISAWPEARSAIHTAKESLDGYIL